MNQYIESLNWRYATKQFDASKKITEENLETLKEAVRLAVSSYGLQPYQVFVIENSEIREQLKAAGYNQSQITDASQLFVFAAKTNLSHSDVEIYMNAISATRNVPTTALDGFANVIKGSLDALTDEQKTTWAQKQCYIALANLISAASLLKIDACPMEGFNAAEFNKILGLDEKGLTATVIAPVGYRNIEDKTQHAAKVRKSTQELFTTIK